ncbi:MAG: desulfoferrodoxin [Deltaproteobacteria bacterium]|nr:desulfoferrodoxin [Deltaproteobacteria bacterium]
MAGGQNLIYKCELCGAMVEVLDLGANDLTCCNEAMVLVEAGTVDAAREKHVPVIEKVAGGVKVKVGSVAHPMEAKHYIEFIEIIADGKLCRKFLKPGEAPEAFFATDAAKVVAREYCNLHGLWQAEV